jgi:hypothetical protein
MGAGEIAAVIGLAVSIVTAAVHLGRRVGAVTEEIREIGATVEEIRAEVRKASDGLLQLRTEHDMMVRNGGCASGEIRT